MELGILIAIIVLAVVNVFVIALIIKKQRDNGSNSFVQTMVNENKKELENMYRLIQTNFDSQLKLIQVYQSAIDQRMNDMVGLTDKNLTNVNEKLKELTISIAENLKAIQQSNEKKLDEMRVTVGEKLDTTLNERLNQSVSVISKQLEIFISGISEVKNLSSGVVDLKNILGNVKNRGTFGEVQLGSLLEQMLAPNQYASQVMINPDSTERVDYVINLPGKDAQNLLLPIDAKFPIEDYLKLQESFDKGNVSDIENYRKQLINQIKKEAKDIKKKYILVPTTTDFAIMYLPTEGLYAEAIKESSLFEELQRDLRITICGPSTISALLNSLQMGFKTLAIEKKSSEIWSLLSQFRKDFELYVELLTKTQKKLSDASKDIENATERSELIKKRLSKVADIGDGGQITQ